MGRNRNKSGVGAVIQQEIIDFPITRAYDEINAYRFTYPILNIREMSGYIYTTLGMDDTPLYNTDRVVKSTITVLESLITQKREKPRTEIPLQEITSWLAAIHAIRDQLNLAESYSIESTIADDVVQQRYDRILTDAINTMNAIQSSLRTIRNAKTLPSRIDDNLRDIAPLYAKFIAYLQQGKDTGFTELDRSLPRK